MVWQLFQENFIVSQVLYVRHGDPLNSFCFLLQKYQPQFNGILLHWTFGGTSLDCVLYLDTKHTCALVICHVRSFASTNCVVIIPPLLFLTITIITDG